MPKASRIDDTIAHSNALLGLVGGLVIGAVVGAAVVASGGTAAVIIATAVAGGATVAGIGQVIGHAIMQNTGKIVTGAQRTKISHRLAARAVEDLVDCHTGQVVAQGSRKVFIEDFPASRIGDKTQCDGTISSGSANVDIGQEPGSYVHIKSKEIPLWLQFGVEVIGLGPGGGSKPKSRSGGGSTHGAPSPSRGDGPSKGAETPGPQKTDAPAQKTDAPAQKTDAPAQKTTNQPLGRGSTADKSKGSKLPENLREQLAVEEAMSNPTAGTELPIQMRDRWPASDGWVKMQQIVESSRNGIDPANDRPINVHYVYNKITGEIDDFKIKF